MDRSPGKRHKLVHFTSLGLIVTGYFVILVGYFDIKFFWPILPKYILYFSVFYYGSQSIIVLTACWNRIPRLHKWLYSNRWSRIFFGWVLPAILLQIPLVWWGYYETFNHFRRNNSFLLFPSILVSVPLWPLFLLLWFIRDQNREIEIRQAKINQLQENFHQLQEWAGNEDVEEPLRISAIHQLERYLTGEVVDSNKPKVNEFQIPTMELFKSLIDAARNRYFEDLRPQQRYYSPKKIKIVEAIKLVLWRVYFKNFSRPLDNLKKQTLSNIDWPDFKFNDCNLQGADLNKSKLQEANLSGADLKRAKLIGSHLMGAGMIGTSLSNADLQYANLTGAILTSANLSKAILVSADLKKTMLNEADLREAIFSQSTKWQEIGNIENTKIRGIKAPDEFVKWAEENGADVVS